MTKIYGLAIIKKTHCFLKKLVTLGRNPAGAAPKDAHGENRANSDGHACKTSVCFVISVHSVFSVWKIFSFFAKNELLINWQRRRPQASGWHCTKLALVTAILIFHGPQHALSF
jgi:hypothetical protein